VELRLEDTFGVSITRDKSQRVKSKASNKSEALKKLEKKRSLRQRLEKELTSNIESYITRSVMDESVVFHAPFPGEKEKWPIPIRWPSKDPRSKTPENIDGEMRPDILLRVSLERLVLPSGTLCFILIYIVIISIYCIIRSLLSAFSLLPLSTSLSFAHS
jgi:hypothetical protein